MPNEAEKAQPQMEAVSPAGFGTYIQLLPKLRDNLMSLIASRSPQTTHYDLMPH